MPTLVFPSGDRLYYSIPYFVTTLNDVQVPESTYWFAHPHYLASTGVRTWGELRDYLAENFPRYRRSQYWVDRLHFGLSDVFSSIGSDPAEWSFNEVFDHDWDDAILSVDTIRVIPNTRTGSSTLVLLDPPEQPTPAPRSFRFDALSIRDRKLLAHVIEESGSPSFQSSYQNPPEWFGRVMNYTYTPELTFYRDEKRDNDYMYFGVELEVSTKLSALELHMICVDVEPKQPLFFFIKSDSSVTGRYDYRYEIVTMPMSPRIQRKMWRTMFEKIEMLCSQKSMSLKDVFDTSPYLNNGLHIHVNGDAFVVEGRGRHERHRLRFLTAFNQWDSSFQQWLQKISKRPRLPKNSDYCHPHPGFDGFTLARRLAKGSQGRIDRGSAHRSACNDTGRTVEVRVFQGVMNLDHIIACIELTEAMFYYTNHAPLTAYGQSFGQRFNEWVLKQPGFKTAKEVLIQCA